ncbi:uncharacterized protein MKK02DRAFT_29226 [Dioszegia hungarica]|uniref:Uncharacterized protein n=1 Tax=Dioszegia hungarica TaxID=4972 RepID=A0AA38LYK1_9TREE|nr:uncharacterized protein MKK02DRAFT_29226 [Dioszegia hungarica]KAI9639089.1 hypothetical protein MKK02DRAFT_29226 [Dioszegia hungarica]
MAYNQPDHALAIPIDPAPPERVYDALLYHLGPAHTYDLLSTISHFSPATSISTKALGDADSLVSRCFGIKHFEARELLHHMAVEGGWRVAGTGYEHAGYMVQGVGAQQEEMMMIDQELVEFVSEDGERETVSRAVADLLGRMGPPQTDMAGGAQAERKKKKKTKRGGGGKKKGRKGKTDQWEYARMMGKAVAASLLAKEKTRRRRHASATRACVTPSPGHHHQGTDWDASEVVVKIQLTRRHQSWIVSAQARDRPPLLNPHRPAIMHPARAALLRPQLAPALWASSFNPLIPAAPPTPPPTAPLALPPSSNPLRDEVHAMLLSALGPAHAHHLLSILFNLASSASASTYAVPAADAFGSRADQGSWKRPLPAVPIGPAAYVEAARFRQAEQETRALEVMSKVIMEMIGVQYKVARWRVYDLATSGDWRRDIRDGDWEVREEATFGGQGVEEGEMDEDDKMDIDEELVGLVEVDDKEQTRRLLARMGPAPGKQQGSRQRQPAQGRGGIGIGGASASRGGGGGGGGSGSGGGGGGRKAGKRERALAREARQRMMASHIRATGTEGKEGKKGKGRNRR